MGVPWAPSALAGNGVRAGPGVRGPVPTQSSLHADARLRATLTRDPLEGQAARGPGVWAVGGGGRAGEVEGDTRSPRGVVWRVSDPTPALLRSSSPHPLHARPRGRLQVRIIASELSAGVRTEERPCWGVRVRAALRGAVLSRGPLCSPPGAAGRLPRLLPHPPYRVHSRQAWEAAGTSPFVSLPPACS